MSRFADSVRERVDAAREREEQRMKEERERRAAELKALQAAQDAATQLLPQVRNRLREVAEASNGAMVASLVAGGKDVEVWRLQWIAPPPKRDLTVEVNVPSGRVRWQLFDGLSPDQDDMDARRFIMGMLDELIRRLCEVA